MEGYIDRYIDYRYIYRTVCYRMLANSSYVPTSCPTMAPKRAADATVPCSW